MMTQTSSEARQRDTKCREVAVCLRTSRWNIALGQRSSAERSESWRATNRRCISTVRITFKPYHGIPGSFESSSFLKSKEDLQNEPDPSNTFADTISGQSFYVFFVCDMKGIEVFDEIERCVFLLVCRYAADVCSSARMRGTRHCTDLAASKKVKLNK